MKLKHSFIEYQMENDNTKEIQMPYSYIPQRIKLETYNLSH